MNPIERYYEAPPDPNSFTWVCCNGKLKHLQTLLNRGDLHVNSKISYTYRSGIASPSASLLAIAIDLGNKEIAKFLVDNGADVNAGSSDPLRAALTMRDLDTLELLLRCGADPTIEHIEDEIPFKTTQRLFNLVVAYNMDQTSRIFPQVSRILEFFFNVGCQLKGNIWKESYYKKFSLLCMAIVQSNIDSIKSMLQDSDYSYFCIISGYSPLDLVYLFYRREIIELFIEHNLCTTAIFLRSAHKGCLDLVIKCMAQPSCDYRARNENGQNGLHVACASGRIEVAKYLMDNYPFDPEAEDIFGRTILGCTDNVEILKSILQHFPEINVNCKDTSKISSMNSYPREQRCSVFAILLKFGADVGCNNDRVNFFHHHQGICCNPPNCDFNKYFQKLSIIGVTWSSLQNTYFSQCNIMTLESEPMSPREEEVYRTEIAKLKTIKISNRIGSCPPVSLYDVFSFDPNTAGRFANNENLLRLYNESNKDFENIFPNYGFILNHQLRRGIRRRRFMDITENWLTVEVFGSDILDCTRDILKFLGEVKLKEISGEARLEGISGMQID